jgi:hypothetical protein
MGNSTPQRFRLGHAGGGAVPAHWYHCLLAVAVASSLVWQLPALSHEPVAPSV